MAGTLTNQNYLVTHTVDGTWTVDPATLTYVANPSSRYFGDANPTFSGTVTGFVNGETLATATTGSLLFTSSATPSSLVGLYPIDGSGLTAANYVFVQAASNATALTIATPPTNPTSQSTPPGGNPPNPGVDISFQNPTGGPIQVSFTPAPGPVNSAANQPNDVVTSALPPGAALTGNHGFLYQPISQYDANQYSQFKLPDYADRGSAATIFTIIARAISADHAADFLIDTFWTGTSGDWKGANGNNPLTSRVTFSDGAGHTVAPTDTDGFPFVAGATDLGQLLMGGPVMIGDGQTPAHWLLATKLTDDGKGIVADDTVSGKEVMLSYNPDTKTVGGITGIFDAKTKEFVALADASGDMPAGSGGPAALQSFAPKNFFAVMVK